MKKTTLLLGSVCCIALNSGAFAEEVSPTDTQGLSFGSILSTMNVGGGSSTAQWQVAPTYSELFGLGVRATVGTYVTDDFALGAIIDIGEYREEYLANAGVRINDNMRIVGSVGILKEQEEFIDGEGREDVQQLEYGLSLKGNYDAGIVRGFELNAYHTNGSSDADSVETGDLTGVQVVTQLKPADSTDIRLGAGYERAEWDGGDVDEGFTLQALGSHKLSDTLSMNFEAKSAETENVYGLGLTYDMSTADIQNSALSVDLMRIEGKHGISDDTRVAVNWTVGFGAGGASAGVSDATVSSMGSIARADLLADVMTRPAFLPERVLARAETSLVCNYTASIYQTTTSPALEAIFVGYLRNSEDEPLTDQETETLEATIVSGSLSVDSTIASTYTADQIFYGYPAIGFFVNPPIAEIGGKTLRILFETADGGTICFEEFFAPF